MARRAAEDAHVAGVHVRLAKIREDFPTWRRFLYYPTLLWLNDRDVMLRFYTLLGLGAAGCQSEQAPAGPPKSGAGILL